VTPTLPTAAQWERWGIDPAWSRTVSVNGADGVHSWHVLENGPTAGALGTIVCVHGNPTWSYLWRHLLRLLGKQYRVIAVDQLGMGWSDRVAPRTYATRVADLGNLIDALAIEGPITMIGHDWGGAVAMGWSVAHQDRLAGMVLCNTGIAVPAGRKAPALIRFAASGPMTDLACRRTRTFVDGTLWLSWGRIVKSAREAYRAPYRSADRRGAVRDFVADVPFDESHPSSGAIAAVADQLRTITAPVLLVWGALDPVFDDSFALDLAERLPHADLHRFAAAGHLAPEEVDVAGVVQRWLADDRAPSAIPSSVEYSPAWSALDARANDTEVAFVDAATGSRTTFAELHRRVYDIARGLRDRGLQPGDRVAVLVPPGVDLVATVYGVWRAGGVTVVADRGLGLRGLGRAVRGATPKWVVGPSKARIAARALRWAPRATFIDVDALVVASDGAEVVPTPSPDSLAAVLYTSGATGPAKGVRYTHRQFAAQRDALAATYSITDRDRLVAAFAPFVLYGPALGIASTVPDVDVTAPGTLTADALVAACDLADATIVFASPAALANVVRTASSTASWTPALARLRLVLSAGAPVPVATLRRVAQLCPAAELHTPYGMTECLPVADVSLTELDVAGNGRGVCVGMPVAGALVRIEAGNVDAVADETGEVLVRTPWMSSGYDRRWGVEHDARPVDASGDVWHRSGDVGHLDADGRLWIEGRSVHLVHTDRGPVSPVPVEVAAETIAGIERSAAVGVGPTGVQQLVVVIESASVPEGLAAPSMATSVREVIVAATGCPVAAVLSVKSLPVDIRHNTKIDRTLVATWAAQVLSGGRTRRPW